MLRKMRTTNSEGFTLIELMIVIAIIGILAAIAIPNFISYRNKAFCSGAEADANQIEAYIADYFAIPEHVSLPGAEAGNSTYLGYQLNKKGTQNTYTISGTANGSITIVITEGNSRCPDKYMDASDDWGTYTYTKVMRPSDY